MNKFIAHVTVSITCRDGTLAELECETVHSEQALEKFISDIEIYYKTDGYQYIVTVEKTVTEVTTIKI